MRVSAICKRQHKPKTTKCLHINIHKTGHIYSKFLSTYIKYKNYFHFEKCTSHFISLHKQNYIVPFDSS